ncbi:MAG TPA: flagellar basal body M-ring protein FliF [Gammaproteobacteria bacterium]|nr:flagellar basal body M-ring protein FliF [Gammaproteobacteria bacterium]
MAMDLVNPQSLTPTFKGMVSLPLLRQLGLLIGLAASIAIGVYVVLWSQEPEYRVLYEKVSAQDASAITQSLEQAGIKYRVDPASGALLVEAGSVHKARMQLASAGLSIENDLGFELLDREEGFGTSQFIQNARYQRALEGELARTIMSMSVVRSARVHLALPKQSSFVRRQKKASASVFLDLYSGRNLSEQQVSAILSLVASSVPNLELEQVTVVDQKGRLLSGGERQGAMALSASQFEHTRKVEQEYIRRIENILGPVVGLENMRAQVVADLDFTTVERTAEVFNPDQPAIRSEQRIEEQSAGSLTAGGIPGALSNEPPAAGVAPEQAGQPGQGGAAGAPSGSRRSRAVTNYEIDRTISHTRRAPGSLRRLSVAVVLNYRPGKPAPQPDATGEPPADGTATPAGGDAELVPVPYTDEELLRFTELVKEAVGFDALRGDSVKFINAPFTAPPEVEPLPEAGILEQPWVSTALKYSGAALVLVVLLFGVLKPIMRSLAQYAHVVERPQAEEGELAEDQLSLTGPEARLPKPGGYEANLNMAQDVVQQDPKLVAQVIKSWVATD